MSPFPNTQHAAAESGPDRPGVGRWWLVAIFAAAIAYRAVCLSAAAGEALLQHPIVDAGTHHAWARRIVAGDSFGHGPDDVFKPPGYPYFLAALYAAFGPRVAVVQWVQILLGAASCVMLAVLVARLLGRAAGRVAGFAAALYAPFAFFEMQLLTPPVSIALNLAALLMLTWRAGRFRPAKLAGAGLLFGLSAVVRPDVLLPAALVAAWALRPGTEGGWRRTAAGAACVAGGVLIAVVPVTARNLHLTGSFVPVSSNAGINFFVGNGAGADGTSAVPVGRQWEALVSRVPQAVLERPARASRWWFARGAEDIARQPARAAARLARKALAIPNAREFRNNICFHFMQRRVWALRLPMLQYALVLPAAAAGLAMLLRRGRPARRAAVPVALWVGGYAAAGLVFFVTARYRLPAVPLLLAPASWFVVEVVRVIAAGRPRKLAVPAGVLAGACLLAWPGWLGSARRDWVRDHVNHGNALRHAGRPQAAERAFRKAIELDPRDPDARYLLGDLLLRRGRLGEAREQLSAALEAAPESADVLLTAARAAAAANDKAAALRQLRGLVALSDRRNLWPKRVAWAQAELMLADLEPEAAEAHREEAWRVHPATAAEHALLRRTDLPRVLEAFRVEAEREPWNWYALANHGMSLLALERYGEAVGPFRRAAALAPEGKEGTHLHLARALAGAGKPAEAIEVLDELLSRVPPGGLRREAAALRRRLAGPGE